MSFLVRFARKRTLILIFKIAFLERRTLFQFSELQQFEGIVPHEHHFKGLLVSVEDWLRSEIWTGSMILVLALVVITMGT